MPTTDHKLELLFEEREILRLINLFDQATNQKDIALFSTLWTKDAVWEIGEPRPFKASGRENVVAMLVKLYESLEFFFRATQTPIIEFHANGQSATGRAGTMELAKLSDGKSYANVAFYADEYRKAEGKWLFAGRHYEYIWVETEVPLPGTSVPRRKN